MKLRSGKIIKEETEEKNIEFEYDYKYNDIYLSKEVFSQIHMEGLNKNFYILKKASNEKISYETARMNVLSNIHKMLNDAFNAEFSNEERMEFLEKGVVELNNFWDKRTMVNHVLIRYILELFFMIKNSDAMQWIGFKEAKFAINLFERRFITY